MKLFILIIFLTMITNSQEFFFDVITFKSRNIESEGRADIYIMIPYSLLKFENSNGQYYSSFHLNIKVLDENDNLVTSISDKQGIVLDDYFQSQGGNGDFKAIQKYFNLKSGNYIIECIINDNLSNQIYKRSSKINILNYDDYPNTLSGLMILSSIEEQNRKFKITPYIDNNLSKIKNGFFIFFEVYSKQNKDTLALNYELVKENNESAIRGKSKEIFIQSSSQQDFLYTNITQKLFGKYKLKVVLSRKINGDSLNESDVLAISEKEVNFTPSFYSFLIDNIDQSIKQMRYIANSDFFNKIESLSVENKIQSFIDFWTNLDPTPNTETNEALIDYYKRVEYTNKNFKSYSDGYLTDKGQVYIVYGPPANISTSNNSYNTREIYEVWSYPNNIEFVFLDKSGLGDFRLVRPFSVSEKYKYNK